MNTTSETSAQSPTGTRGAGAAARRLLLSSAVAIISFHAPSFVSPKGQVAYACGYVCAQAGGFRSFQCQAAGRQGGVTDCRSWFTSDHWTCSYAFGGISCPPLGSGS